MSNLLKLLAMLTAAALPHLVSAQADSAPRPTAAASSSSSSSMALPPLVAAGKLGAGWRVLTLPRQKPPVTRYGAETVADREALRVEVQGSYGNLVYEPRQAQTLAPRRLQWSWRLAQPNAGTDLSQRGGDDLAVKVCLSFDMPLQQVPFFERELLRLARARSGEALPAATLCWVWAGAEARDTVIDNPFSRRVRYIVLRNKEDTLNTWIEETRDVAADFRRAFGDEAQSLPPLTAVIVSGDGDNTGLGSLAFVAGLRVLP